MAFGDEVFGEVPFGEDSGGGAGGSPALLVNAAAETDLALPLGIAFRQIVALGQAAEVSSAFVLAPHQPAAQVSRVHLETLARIRPDAQVARVHVETLATVLPDARVDRQHIEVLIVGSGPSVVGVGVARQPETSRQIYIEWVTDPDGLALV